MNLHFNYSRVHENTCGIPRHSVLIMDSGGFSIFMDTSLSTSTTANLLQHYTDFTVSWRSSVWIFAQPLLFYKVCAKSITHRGKLWPDTKKICIQVQWTTPKIQGILVLWREVIAPKKKTWHSVGHPSTVAPWHTHMYILFMSHIWTQNMRLGICNKSEWLT